MRRLVVATAISACLAASTTSAAEPRSDDAARADALFAEGKQEMAAGHHARACALFGESYALDPSDGTLLALGLCHEQEGDHVRAWRELRDADSRATKSGREDRQRIARAALARVTPRVARIVIHGAADRGCAAVKLDGVAAPPDDELAVDPGPHKVTCERAARSTTVGVDAVAGSLRVVDIPAEPTAAAPESEPARGEGLRTLGFILGGVGIAGLGAGGIFGLRAMSQWSAVKDKCDPLACTEPSAVADTDAARRSATIATVGVAAGAVLLVAGLYLVLTNAAPKKVATGSLR